jgi:hypothetical protein
MNIKRSSTSLNAAIFGVPKFFVPRWFNWNIFQYNNSHEFNILPSQWTYTYDNSLLEKILEKYIDLKLSPNVKLNNINTKNDNIDCKNIPRLIITAVDVLSAEPIISDGYKHRYR